MASSATVCFLIVLIGIIFSETQQISLAGDPTYNAGVVELKPSHAATLKNRVKENLANMKDIIESEATQDLDILVFPEFVLNDDGTATYVPDPKDNLSPCENPNYDWFLRELSCATRSRKLYMVINVVEKEQCNPKDVDCTVDGLKHYNTNVVFDREGRVISRYRKTHLYRYEWLTKSVMDRPQLATFATDFGVTFGHFICFDMLFYDPAQVLIREMNITDIIYPTYWFSELPFLTAVQLQEGWAFANNVNLLAADASYPEKQNTGSGIYAGRLGRLQAVIYEEATTKLLTAKVPKQSARNSYELPALVKPVFQPQLETARFTKLDLLRDYNVDIFTTKLLEETFTTVNETLCHGEFCCKFNLERVKHQDSVNHQAYRYRLAAYSGTKTTFQRMDSSNQSVCAVIACTGPQLYQCGHIYPEEIKVGNIFYFKAIHITGDFVNSARRLIMPSTVDGLMMPLTVDSFDWIEMESPNATRIAMSLNSPQQNLLTFGIWANYYSNVQNTHNLDSSIAVAATPNSASSFATSSTVVVTVLLVLQALLFKY